MTLGAQLFGNIDSPNKGHISPDHESKTSFNSHVINYDNIKKDIDDDTKVLSDKSKKDIEDNKDFNNDKVFNIYSKVGTNVETKVKDDFDL